MSVDDILEKYQAWLDSVCYSGRPAPCTDVTLTNLVKDRLLEEPELHGALHNDAFSLIASGLRGSEDLQSSLQHLSDAFQVLEQAALHLYFAPWRKEFHTIKTYSGLYVYALEGVLAQEGVLKALQRLGYEPQDDGCNLSIMMHRPTRCLSAAATGFFAAQVECRILSNILFCGFPGVVTGTDLIRERRSCRGEAACMERLQRLTVGSSSPPNVKSPGLVGISESEVVSDGAISVYEPPICTQCHETWDPPVSGYYRAEAHAITPFHLHEIPLESGETQSKESSPEACFGLHDCVFIDKSMEWRCAECRLLHSFQCSRLAECRDSGHSVSKSCLSEKQEAIREEERNKYQTHYCLQPDHLPHYRCDDCMQLHYIKCPEVSCCRVRSHNVSMIMLEKHQRQWLQQSKRDLSVLALESPPQTGN